LAGEGKRAASSDVQLEGNLSEVLKAHGDKGGIRRAEWTEIQVATSGRSEREAPFEAMETACKMKMDRLGLS
jgi:hypothetical protein